MVSLLEVGQAWQALPLVPPPCTLAQGTAHALHSQRATGVNGWQAFLQVCFQMPQPLPGAAVRKPSGAGRQARAYNAAMSSADASPISKD
ncbi:MAG: hypothetical protein E2582_16695, partial [Delftia sp.]|nr:hypothetical protein [Delftia sp.]